MALESTFALAFMILGIILLLVEAVTPGSFIIVPATVLIVLGIIGLINSDWLFIWWSPIIAVIIMIPMTYAAFKLYQMLAPPAPPETTVGTSLIGKTGVVITRVVPGNITGKVRIANDTWSSTADVVIPKGTKVHVVRSEGVHVVVEPIQYQGQ
jgi:membrane protein implicated in regulation of membrane protease activity